ncbi:T9SS type A sorting domain-containing protein [Edaphocola aurantiacus]|uniref:T9SS type A sorting domain-containing protein n=1 Tax=Edaphocola aurantiacus TaxID=2601682 RepID=UPI001C94A704|nr:T9SS type A sorting domain-containing protein [Edaphocola aurantiacus]
MKKLYSLLAGLFFAGTSLYAQPCANFNNPTTPGANWVATGVTASFGDTNPLDGTTCVRLRDLPGYSRYTNSVDFTNIGQKFPGQCICFDFFLLDDGGYGGVYHPFIILSDGTNEIMFTASTGVTKGNGWIHVCAPITFCTGSTMPSNSDGSWSMLTPGMTCADFNNVLSNAKTLSVTPDITSSPTEIVLFDNICVERCGGCNTDFELKTSFSSVSNDATANVSLLNMDPYSTYKVSWGDGGAFTTPYVSHLYTTPGSYTVCVMQQSPGELGIACSSCITFCYSGADRKQDAKTTKTTAIPDLKAIAEAEMKTANNDLYRIYPNPADGYTTVQLDLDAKATVSIKVKDMMGKVLNEVKGNYNEGRQQIRLNTEHLTPGAYNVEITVGEKITVQKLAISK